MALLLGSTLAVAQCGGGSSPTAPVTTIDTPVPVTIVISGDPAEIPTTPPVIPAPGNASAFVNVPGDTGWCGFQALAPIAGLFERFDGDILLAGDLAYPSGTLDEFRRCFEPSFGKFKSRMRPTPGNHEYVASASAEPYFTYFGDRSGPNRLGFYSFLEAEWTVRMLNSSIPIGRNSVQFAFVRQVMLQAPTRCTMAVMHYPFDSSSLNGPTPALRDDAKGIRQVTVGTGGATLYGRVRNAASSELMISTYGILRLNSTPRSTNGSSWT
jgi:hypothetical protein